MHTLDYYSTVTDKAKSHVEQHGGKAGLLLYLLSLGNTFKKLILPLYLNESYRDNQADLSGPVIVRASHPGDVNGLVDVLKTARNLDFPKIEGEIDIIRAHAQSAAVTKYAKYENPFYDGKVTIMVQPYLNMQRGSVVEHPNQPENYVLSLIEEDEYSPRGERIRTGICDYRNNCYNALCSLEINLNDVMRLVELYRLVKRAEIIRDDYSFQMEFVNCQNERKSYITQVRSFTRKEIAKFAINDPTRRLVFGITPEEGITLPVLQSPDGFLYKDYNSISREHSKVAPLEPFSTPWAFLRTTHNDQLPLSFTPRNMHAYLVGQSWGSGITPSLEHNHFRMAQKAPVTVFEGFPDNEHSFTQLMFEVPRIRNSTKRALQEIEMYAEISSRNVANPLQQWQIELQVLRNKSGLQPNRVHITSDGKTATTKVIF